MRAPFLDRLGPPPRAERIKAKIPWFVKLGAKLLLGRLSVPYGLWRRLELFKMGEMLDPRYAVEVYRWHYERVKPYLPTGYSALELGPGDSLATAFVAPAFGAARTWLVDVGEFAATGAGDYYRLLAYMSEHGMAAPSMPPAATDVRVMLEAAGSAYRVGGLGSLREVEGGSVDFVFSQHVLEHVRRSEFRTTMAELFRVLRPGGVASHSIDFDDHMSQSLNSLRFSPETWESDRWASAGFYSNRLRASEVLAVFRETGYELVDRVEHRWPSIPLSRRKLHAAFAHFEDDDLRIQGLDVVLRKT